MTFRRALLASSTLIVLGTAIAVARVSAQELPRDLRQIAGLFPQSEPGPLERQAKPVTPENPIPRRTRLVRPSYPSDAAVVGARATVTLRVTVDHLGTVAEVRTVGVPILGAMSPPSPAEERAFTAGLLALIRSAKDAVGQWLYEPPADGPIAFDVVIGFSTDGDGEVLVHGTPAQGGPGNPAFVPLPPSLAGLAPAPPWAEGAIRVGGQIRQPTKTRHVAPVYPLEAKEAKVTGVVILEARIEADGRVINARILRSIPPLDQAALDAVTQWEFTPTLMNGVPTPVMMTVTIQFSLQ
jgi:protein TonB